jgi:hypothetical protein
MAPLFEAKVPLAEITKNKSSKVCGMLLKVIVGVPPDGTVTV